MRSKSWLRMLEGPTSVSSILVWKFWSRNARSACSTGCGRNVLTLSIGLELRVTLGPDLKVTTLKLCCLFASSQFQVHQRGWRLSFSLLTWQWKIPFSHRNILTQEHNYKQKCNYINENGCETWCVCQPAMFPKMDWTKPAGDFL